jgi:IS30 family transposase
LATGLDTVHGYASKETVMPTGKHLTKEYKDKIIKLKKERVSARDIADYLGLWEGTIQGVWREHNRRRKVMDLMTMLDKLEKEFFRRIDTNTVWGKEVIKMEFNEAVRNILVTTYPRVMKDAKE